MAGTAEPAVLAHISDATTHWYGFPLFASPFVALVFVLWYLGRIERRRAEAAGPADDAGA